MTPGIEWWLGFVAGAMGGLFAGLMFPHWAGRRPRPQRNKEVSRAD